MVPPPPLPSYVVPILESLKGSKPSVSALMDSPASATLMRGAPALEHMGLELCLTQRPGNRAVRRNVFEPFGFRKSTQGGPWSGQ